jgi:hypothetical protein
MTTPAFEAFLAKVYTDEEFRREFLTEPEACARRAGLSAEEAQALARIDRTGLTMAAETFAHKRARQMGRGRLLRWWRRL